MSWACLPAQPACRAVCRAFAADRRPASVPPGVCAACMLCSGLDWFLRRCCAAPHLMCPSRHTLSGSPVLRTPRACAHSWQGQWLGSLSRSRAREPSGLRPFNSCAGLLMLQVFLGTVRFVGALLSVGGWPGSVSSWWWELYMSRRWDVYTLGHCWGFVTWSGHCRLALLVELLLCS